MLHLSPLVLLSRQPHRAHYTPGEAGHRPLLIHGLMKHYPPLANSLLRRQEGEEKLNTKYAINMPHILPLFYLSCSLTAADGSSPPSHRHPHSLTHKPNFLSHFNLPCRKMCWRRRRLKTGKVITHVRNSTRK